MADPKYMDGVFINKKEFANGGHIIKMDIVPEKLIAWLKNAPVTDKGYIKTQIQSKREPELDQFGNIKMFCSLDSYFHKDGAAPSQPAPAQSAPPTQDTVAPASFDDNFDVDGDDIPF